MKLTPFVLMFAALAGCDTAPDVVSFNTPELCQLQRTAITSFTLAAEACEDGCQVCIDSTYDDQALTYALAANDTCVCPAPVIVEVLELDAAVFDAEAPDAQPDAGPVGAPNVAPDGCNSQLNLTQGGAAVYCEGKQNCEVCIERVDFDNEARRYMAHECGCPSAYRVE